MEIVRSFRLSLGFGVLCLFLVVLGAFSIMTESKINKTTLSITDNWMPSISRAYQMKLTVARFDQVEREYLKTGSADTEKELASLSQSLKTTVNDYLAHSISAEGKQIAQIFLTDFDAFENTHRQIADQVHQGKLDGARLMYDYAAQRFLQSINDGLDKLIAVNESQARHASALNRQQYAKGRGVIVASSLLAFLVSALLSWWIVRSIVGPIRTINRVLEDLSQAKGDLSRKIMLDTGDEIGKMAENVNQVLDTVGRMVRQIRSTTQEVAASSRQIEENCERLSISSDEIASAITKLSRQSLVQMEKTQDSHQSLQQYAQRLNQVAAFAEETYELSTAANARSEKGHLQIQGVLANMNSIQEQNLLTQISMHAFQRTLLRIEEINTLITDISQQTQLLSLNASIEAARAGEQGRGFAVVAEEIRKMSNQTGQSSIGIVELLNEINKEVAKIIGQFKQNTKSIEQGNEQMKEALEMFSAMSGTNHQVMNNAETTKREVEQTAWAIGGVLESSHEIVLITDEQSAASEEIAANAQEQEDSTRRIVGLTSALSSKTDALKQLIDQFHDEQQT